MTWPKRRFEDITINLDSRRVPIKEENRSAKSGTYLYPYVGANKIIS